MRSTWILAVAAVAALSAGTAIAASAAEPELRAGVTPAWPARAAATSLGDAPLPSAVGTTVPTEAVAATGASVHVSPSGHGEGLVTDPAAPLPDAIVEEIDTVDEPVTALRAAIERAALRDALDAADARVLVVYATPTFDGAGNVTGVQYGVAANQEAPLEFATSHHLRTSPSHDLAVASWQPFLATNPQYTLVDTTTAG